MPNSMQIEVDRSLEALQLACAIKDTFIGGKRVIAPDSHTLSTLGLLIKLLRDDHATAQRLLAAQERSAMKRQNIQTTKEI